ncbi:MAG: long-chain fatty acid--CoA ligase [Mariprofundus sp.]|nr:long-chain fatty acid--CoA ligase [Mariprofundus sp.]
MVVDSASIDDALSLPEVMFKTATTRALEPAQWCYHQGQYLAITYAQMASRIRHISSGLLRAGVRSGDRIAILMENIPEWAVIDYAILSIGAVTVPLYCSSREQDIHYLLKDSGAKIVFVSGAKLLNKLFGSLEQIPHLQQIYALEPSTHKQVASIASLEACELDQVALDHRLGQLHRDTLATLVYTSGTTDKPKGVMLTHGNILTNLESVPSIFALSSGTTGDRMLSFLPLAHALERTGSHFLCYSFGLSVAFAERPDTVAKNMAEAKPTLMVTVPRMLELIRSRILGEVARQSPVKQKLFQHYLKLAAKDKMTFLQRIFHQLLDHMIGEKIRQRFGGRVRAFICGGAPLNIEVAQFFESLGLPIIEGYGLSESAPLLSVNPMHDRRLGSVGIAGKGVELRISDDGEILARGSNIMPGYWKKQRESKETLRDGWLHTGDIGTLDSDGYLRITDRKKEIIINSGGENISPQKVEQQVLRLTEVEQVVIFGDNKPHLVAFIVANEAACRKWGQALGLPESDWQQLCASKLLRKHLHQLINSQLKGLNTFEQIRRIHILSMPFTMENGLLTPTLKIKRRKVFEQYAPILTELYQ